MHLNFLLPTQIESFHDKMYRVGGHDAIRAHPVLDTKIISIFAVSYDRNRIIRNYPTNVD